MTKQPHGLPVAIIGAGPVGLAVAANLIERGLTPHHFRSGGGRRGGHFELGAHTLVLIVAAQY